MNNAFPNIERHLATCAPNADRTVYTGGRGACLITEDGRQVVNLNDISCVLGYEHPRFTRELAQLVQTRLLAHGGTFSPYKEQLFSHFMQATHGDFERIFFAGSGGEVVDWSIKAARRYTGRDGIISFRNALHGRSFAGAFISGIPTRKEGFGTGLEHITFWDYPEDGRDCEIDAGDGQDIAAVIIEPWQALSGMAAPSAAYWQWLRRYTRERGILLIFDEIQTGFGKTGSLWAYEATGVVPDLLLAGKGMSNGFGLGAMLMSEAVGASVRPGELSGGSADNDLMCGVVELVFDILEQEKLPEHALTLGRSTMERIRSMLAEKGIPGEVRGKGLFFSILLPEGQAERIAAEARKRGVLFGRSGGRLLVRPPLVITEAEMDRACEVLEELLPL